MPGRCWSSPTTSPWSTSAVNAVHPARFVSKADVGHWPFIGYLVASGGTLFIERERKRDALRVVHQIAAALQAGDIVAVFPEGTTSDGHDVLPFHANLLQAAIATAAPVQPLVLRYRDAHAAVSRAELRRRHQPRRLAVGHRDGRQAGRRGDRRECAGHAPRRLARARASICASSSSAG